jgi:hypothetical protein
MKPERSQCSYLRGIRAADMRRVEIASRQQSQRVTRPSVSAGFHPVPLQIVQGG